MLDPKFIAENIALVEQNCARRSVPFDSEFFLGLYAERRVSLQDLEHVRQTQNALANQHKGNLPEEALKEMRRLKKEKERLEAIFEELDTQFRSILLEVPNLSHPDVPQGGEDDARVLRTWGERSTLPQMALEHSDLVSRFDLVDFASASRVVGAKFCFFKNEAVRISLALIQFVIDFLFKKNKFSLLETPDLAREEIVEGTGFNPRGESSQIYKIANSDLCLIGTSEVTVAGFLSGSVLNAEDLPQRFLSLSHCFRTEAGSYGRVSKGLYRLRQFTKLEMFAVTTPNASEDMLEELVSYQEGILQALELPYRVCDIAAGDLGAPAYRKIDLEAWMPFRGENGSYGEISSASNCTDFQARRLNIRIKGSREYAHTLNGTALAVPRILLALLENGQREDGSVRLPEALVPWLGFSEIRPR
ncbi:serine--tRNA ligase [Candidatus Similichlamydia laticola]|uniref:Serine--tRNA ligase n=1 Tax=Candidatus Similichlamydia laticola TaxID=2170265 RepID=A0A369KAH0_9BACT|nr:serine--tRNA ligase [Candidatus Similichlamydia laticola]RDB31599.1 Seryl-tRNA synthetase [Candidatus Similichlamydia laticola]